MPSGVTGFTAYLPAYGHFIYFHVGVHEESLVKVLDGGSAAFVVVHFNIAAAEGVAGMVVHDDADGGYFAELEE